jgi:PucR family transcriptional regulator, proline-responsive transcriptional activator
VQGVIGMKLNCIAAELKRRWPGCEQRLTNPECELNGVTWGTGFHGRGMLHVYPSSDVVVTEGIRLDECCLTLSDCNAENLIIAADKETLEEIVNLVEFFFAKMQELGHLFELSLGRKINLQGIVDMATEILDNPMLVADPNNEITAMSNVDWDDSAWRRFQEMKRLPYHPDISMSYAQIAEQVSRGELVKVVDGQHKKGYFIRGAVVEGLNLIGQVHVFSWHHEFTEIDVELVHRLCGVLASEIERVSGGGDAIRSSSDYFLSDLIRGNLRNPELVESRLAFLNWNLKKYKYLLLVQWEEESRNIDFRDACMSALNSLFPDGHSILDGTNMVVLFSSDEKLNGDSTLIDSITAYLKKTDLVAVLSMAFTELRDAAYRYDQACDILNLNRRLGREDQFVLAEASAFELLLQEASHKYNLLDYCHPLVLSLMEYDQREGKDYLSTLRAYAISGMNFTKAAEILHMHRNSVIYRLKQIEEILNFDFSTMEFVFHIDLSFRILDYLDSIQNHRWIKKDDSQDD